MQASASLLDVSTSMPSYCILEKDDGRGMYKGRKKEEEVGKFYTPPSTVTSISRADPALWGRQTAHMFVLPTSL